MPLLVWLIGVAIGANAGAAAANEATTPTVGQALFVRNCASCHGVSGAGDGPNSSSLAAAPRDLRSEFLNRYSDTELIDRVLAGSNLRIEFDADAVRQRSGETEAIVSHITRLPKLDWVRFDRGWEIYATRCESCHGLYGKPPLASPPGVGHVRDLGASDYQAAVSDTELLTTARHGRHGMPALVPQITHSEAVSLTSFLRALSPGFAIYSQTCAQCHGDRGHGVGTLVEQVPLPTIVFDANYFARVDRDDLRNRIWHMLAEHRPQMPHFRDSLTRDDAAAVIRYLKSAQSPPAAELSSPTPQPQ